MERFLYFTTAIHFSYTYGKKLSGTRTENGNKATTLGLKRIRKFNVGPKTHCNVNAHARKVDRSLQFSRVRVSRQVTHLT